MPVVKANAYGHDLLLCAPLLAGAGAEWLGVTGADEGAAVRAVCPQPRILLLSGILGGEAETVIAQGLTPVVWEPWQLDLLETAATARGLPAGSLAVHLEIDTGMSRQGVRGGGNRCLGGSCCRAAAFSPWLLPPAGGGDDSLLRSGNHVFPPPQSSVDRHGRGIEIHLWPRLAPAMATCRQLLDHRRRIRPAGPEGDGVERWDAADVAPWACPVWLPRPSHPGRALMGCAKIRALPRCSAGRPR